MQGCKAARLQGCKAARPNNLSKSIKFILFPAFLSLLLSSNSVYAANAVYGDGAQASGFASSVFGQGAQASGDFSTATGQGAQASGGFSTATGQEAKASGDFSTATGQGAKASGEGSTAIGVFAQASGVNSVALGESSKAKNDNEVNIGIWSDDEQTGTRTLSGLADGKNSDEAVNKGQLDSETGKLDTRAQGYANTAESNANKYTDEQISKVDTSGVLNKARDYTNDTAKQTLKSANENTENRAVVAENNAVTRSNAYTDESSAHTLKSANTYTNQRAVQAENNAVARSNAYTDNRFGELRKNLEHTEKRLNAGIAGVTALSSIPYVEGNRFSYGIGAGNYQNGNAVAAGVQFRVSPSTNVRLNISWDSAGNNATGVGIAGGW
ncbi:TPA: YadA-like family protein [Salmonella enterica subsp. diarizonae serovar 61:r:-]